MKIGYARVSKTDQKLELQTDALTAAGVEQIFTDKISGSKDQRDGLEKLLAIAREGDCVVVWRLDRLARSLKHLIELAALFESRGIQLISLSENIDTTTTTGKLFFQIFGALAEFERNVIIERTRAGLEAAKARGRSGGRKPVLTPEKRSVVQKLLKDSTDYRSIALAVGASERTIRRFATGDYN
jgi:DNA invertase Pin-like site-specific DNA recombinase